MGLGERLHLYKGILGNSDNSIKTRFKLIRAVIRNNGVDGFYSGVRADDTGYLNFNEIRVDLEHPGKFDLFRVVTARNSVFRRVDNTNYYCDVLDDWTACTLVTDTTYTSSRGCYNIEKIDAKQLVKLKIDGGI